MCRCHAAQAKEDCTELLAAKAEMDTKIVQLAADSKAAEEIMRKKAQQIGNIVHESVPISESEVRAPAPGNTRQRGESRRRNRS